MSDNVPPSPTTTPETTTLCPSCGGAALFVGEAYGGCRTCNDTGEVAPYALAPSAPPAPAPANELGALGASLMDAVNEYAMAYLAKHRGFSSPNAGAELAARRTAIAERVAQLVAAARSSENRAMKVAAHATSVTLDDVLSEQHEDTRRLDWLQENAAHVEPLFSCDPEEPGWRVRSEESLDFGEGNTLREAIDFAARASRPTEETDGH